MNQWLMNAIGPFIFIQLFVSHIALAQTSDTQSWNSILIDWNFRASMLVELELDYNQLISGGETWREYAIQPVFEYYPDNTFDLFGGIYLSNTKQNNTKDTKEVRPMAGIRWNIIKPERRVFFRSQFKYEYRYFISDEDKDRIASRIRLRLDLFIPITKKSYNEDNNLYGKIFTEGFYNFDNEIRERFQSTFRQYIGLGYRYNYSYRLELDYVYQTSRDSIEDENPDNISNVVNLTFKYYIQTRR